MQLQQFIVAQWQLVLIFVLSGGMLLWPLVHRRVSGVADAGTLQVTQLINNEKAVTVDLRETKELTDGKLPGAVHIPLSQLKERVGELREVQGASADRYAPRLLSRAAGSVLGRAGFTKLFNLAGGHKAWKDAGLPLDKN
ncbi:MAG: rhodanese-like domain-containing protein [Betaproteobacteria bacterium]|nr:rhodanese-like domain-containing protein [Betaproteobacteria bacterium]